MEAADWDARYAATDLVWSAAPNVWVEELVSGMPPGRALDIAAGEGRNALWLVEQGWEVEHGAGERGIGAAARELAREQHVHAARAHAMDHAGAADVEAGEALVEGQAERVLPQLGGGPFGESAVPQGLCGVLVLVRHRSSN